MNEMGKCIDGERRVTVVNRRIRDKRAKKMRALSAYLNDNNGRDIEPGSKGLVSFSLFDQSSFRRTV